MVIFKHCAELDDEKLTRKKGSSPYSCSSPWLCFFIMHLRQVECFSNLFSLGTFLPYAISHIFLLLFTNYLPSIRCRSICHIKEGERHTFLGEDISFYKKNLLGSVACCAQSISLVSATKAVVAAA